MFSKEELQKKYADFDDEQILKILANKSDYTEIATDVASEEFKRRKLDSNTLENETKFIEESKKLKIENERLNLFSKFLYFVFSFTTIGLIVAYQNKNDFNQRGSRYKSSQILYYSATGIIIILGCIIYSIFFDSNVVFLIPIIIAFIIFLLLENKFLKNLS
jgi:hypothetical protein